MARAKAMTSKHHEKMKHHHEKAMHHLKKAEHHGHMHAKDVSKHVAKKHHKAK